MALKTGDWDGRGEAPQPVRQNQNADRFGTERFGTERLETERFSDVNVSCAVSAVSGHDGPQSRPQSRKAADPSFNRNMTDNSGDITSPLSTHPLETLINMRDRFLSECFDIESGRRYVIDADDAESRLSVLRQRIDEIHQEMAQRDMGRSPSPTSLGPLRPTVSTAKAAKSEAPVMTERPSERTNQARGTNPAPQSAVPNASTPDDFLSRMEARIRLLDRLAEQAEAQGALADAVKCMLAAQKLDREREAFLTERAS